MSAEENRKKTREPSTSELVAELVSSDPERRIQACLGLSEREIPTTCALLIPATREEDARVRQAAVLALGKVRGPGVRRALERALSDSVPEVVETAREALTGLDRMVRPWKRPSTASPEPPAEPVSLILELCNDPDPQMRVQAVTSLGALEPGTPGVCQTLAAALEDAFHAVRARAALGISRHPSGAAFKKLVELLEDVHHEVRSASARTLGMVREGQAFVSLVSTLGDDYQSVRVEASRALARIGGDLVSRELHHAATTWVAGSPPILEALLVLDEDVQTELELWLDHPYEGVRGVAVDWIVSRRDRRLFATLSRLTRDPVDWVREEVSDALMRLS